MKTKLERIRRDIESISRFSTTKEGGTTRFAFTPEHAGAREYIMAQMEAAGLKVYQDAAGTVVGRREGREPGAPAVMTGSHFDTVRCGGNFDGVAGVAAGIEAARVMRENGIVTRRPLEFIAMVEEEGARFGSAVFGSRAMAGLIPPEELDGLLDEEGVSTAAAMLSFGLDPARIGDAARDPKSLYAFLEFHIEQGPVLEAGGTDLGIVRTIVANRTLELTITGRANHAGTTPMDMRADAFEAAARVSLAAIEEARAAGDGTVATMGQISVLPGSSNIVPGRVVFTLDIRSPRETLVERVQRKALSVLERLCAENRGLQSSFRMLLNSPAVELDPHVLDALGKSADACGFSRRDMVSGAGHDAMVMARMVPTGMLFAPSRGGRSHCPEEWTDFEQLQKGTETLLGALISLADE